MQDSDARRIPASKMDWTPGGHMDLAHVDAAVPKGLDDLSTVEMLCYEESHAWADACSQDRDHNMYELLTAGLTVGGADGQAYVW